MKFFVDAIAKQVIERHLVAVLPAILAPKTLARYDDKDIKYVASEPVEMSALRDHLHAKKEMLEEGQNAFRAAMGNRFC
jgi:hypothetical protein